MIHYRSMRMDRRTSFSPGQGRYGPQAGMDRRYPSRSGPTDMGGGRGRGMTSYYRDKDSRSALPRDRDSRPNHYRSYTK